jgi:ABC-2 type transport system ATP-binding protein
VRLEAVGKRYGIREPWVVRGVSADLPAGRLIRVAGRNGSGKSTLLRVVAGVSRPSAGKVSGRPHCGYVPERFPGGLPFSGREYLRHLARVHGLRGETGRRRVEAWLERLGAADYADQSLRSASKGMCQKIAIAQALLPSPGLLVLDEAWTGLDQAARGELDAAVMERVAAGGSAVFVDHDPARLAGREDERWNFDGAGAVTVLAGPVPQSDLAPQSAPRVERVTIRLETTDAADVIGQVRAIERARVLSVDVERTEGA